MEWQEIINQHIIPQIKKNLLNNDLPRFNDFKDKYLKNNKVKILDDKEAEELALETL
jgi:hypothetical protein